MISGGVVAQSLCVVVLPEIDVTPRKSETSRQP